MLTKREFKIRLINGCKMVIDARDELTQADAMFGDADHGHTMAKIAEALKNSVRHSNGSIREIMENAAAAVLLINGGDEVPIWYAWLCGLAEHAPADADVLHRKDLQSMFANALKSLDTLTTAKVGDKTMMDALIPATEAICSATGSINDLFFNAADAAEAGMEYTKEVPAKFGRAAEYGDETIGYPDPGAMSMMCFFVGLSDRF